MKDNKKNIKLNAKYLWLIEHAMVTEPYEIKNNFQAYQNTPLQNTNLTSTRIWGRDMGAI